jgi:hypothetical protein
MQQLKSFDIFSQHMGAHWHASASRTRLQDYTEDWLENLMALVSVLH